MNTLRLTGYLLLFSFSFLGCQQTSGTAAEKTDVATSQVSATARYERVDNATFKAKMQEEDVVIIDVRTPAETAKGTIATARQIDYRADDFAAQIAALPRDKTYLVYCQSGGRSAKAAALMQEMGFETIYELANGYGGWE